jgi:hypothetical protein
MLPATTHLRQRLFKKSEKPALNAFPGQVAMKLTQPNCKAIEC